MTNLLLKLVALLGLVCLAGCSNEEPSSEDEDSVNNEDTELAEDTGEAEDTDTYIELCGTEDIVEVMDGEYHVYNNVWGFGEGVGDQCIAVKDNSFEVVLCDHFSPSAVAAYPFVLKGCHFGACTEDSGMPIPIDEIETAEFSWRIETPPGGCWNAAYESWYSDPETGQIAAEQMIWIDYHGPAVPTGSVVDTVSIAGHEWEVSTADNGWSQYIAYVITEPIDSVDFDLTEFIDDTVARGVMVEDAVLEGMEAGFEIWYEGQGLKTISFTGRVE